MRNAWQVVLVAPTRYPHWRVFQEPAELLQAGLSDLGLDCTLKVNALSAHRINVVLGYHLLNPGDELRQVPVVPYQMEQLGVGVFDTPRARDVLRCAVAVWDFSSRNIETLAADGIAATLVPLGYHRALEVLPDCEPDIDVLFSGGVTPRRAAVLESLKARGIQVGLLFGAYGVEKQVELARARIHVHIHAADGALFQQPRIAHLLNNRCFVVSEVAQDNPYPKVDLVQVEASDLADECRYYLERPRLRDEIAERCYQQFRANYPMVEALRAGVEAVQSAILDRSPEGDDGRCP